ncbi:peptidylprolyl isomerase [Aliikangiella marina]|uniref:Peptidyl-prolyl cis-trans isomerase n=1 Tax=Aliikangiella marina TaxID=1712262 RepID=A0A545T6X9_9GAMM|nr:peptidylprolyl isomerase [Aliikangiella marina]TQV72980.1 peptidylprolyl isomerase [Aliikangiella marina]
MLSYNLPIKSFRTLVCFTFVFILGACTSEDPLISATKQFIAEQNIDQSKSDWKINLPKPPQQTFNPDKKYYWEMTTSEGPITIELMPSVAPMHVSSTVYLTTLGFYDDLTFHRVITGFMAQGGDPYGNGVGGPGYKYSGEFSPQARHDKAGILSMANAGANTDGSQFFITFKPTPHLDDRHTVFGQVVAGMETVKAIEKLGSRRGTPKKEIKIVKASIRID